MRLIWAFSKLLFPARKPFIDLVGCERPFLMLTFKSETADVSVVLPPYSVLATEYGFRFNMTQKIKKIKIIIAQTLLETNWSDGANKYAFDRDDDGKVAFLKNFGKITSGNGLNKLYLFHDFEHDDGTSIHNCVSRTKIVCDSLWCDILGEGVSVKFKSYMRFPRKGVCTVTLSCLLLSEEGVDVDKLIPLLNMFQTSKGRQLLKINTRHKWKYFPKIDNVESFFVYSKKQFCKSAGLKEGDIRSSDVYLCAHVSDISLSAFGAQMIRGIVNGDSRYKELPKVMLKKDFGKYRGDYVILRPHKVVAFSKKPHFSSRSPYLIWSLFRGQEQLQGDLLAIRSMKDFLQSEILRIRKANHKSKDFVKNMFTSTQYVAEFDEALLELLYQPQFLSGGPAKIRFILEEKSFFNKERLELEKLRLEYVNEVNNWKPGSVKLLSVLKLAESGK